MRLHELKVAPEAFLPALLEGRNPLVVPSDRTFREGDAIRLREWQSVSDRLPAQVFTGYTALVLVVGVTRADDASTLALRGLVPFAPPKSRKAAAGDRFTESRLRREASEQVAHLQRFKTPAGEPHAEPNGPEVMLAAAAHDAAVVALARVALALEMVTRRPCRARDVEAADVWQRVANLERARAHWTTSGDWRPANETGFAASVATLVREGYVVSQKAETEGVFRSALMHRHSDGAGATVTWESA